MLRTLDQFISSGTCLLILSLVTALVGICGDTFDKNLKYRFTRTGWCAIALFILTFLVGWRQNRLESQENAAKDRTILETSEKVDQMPTGIRELLQDPPAEFLARIAEAVRDALRDPGRGIDKRSPVPPPPPRSFSPPMVEAVTKALTVFSQAQRLFRPIDPVGAIADEQRKNIYAFAVIPKEEVLLGVLADGKTMKEGIAFTDRGIHVADRYAGVTHLSYADFAKVKVNSHFISLDFDGKKVISTGHASDYEKVLEAVQAALRKSVQKDPSG